MTGGRLALLLPSVTLMGALAGAPLAAQEGCAVSKDLVVRALELVSATPSHDDLSNGILLLKQAEEACDKVLANEPEANTPTALRAALSLLGNR